MKAIVLSFEGGDKVGERSSECDLVAGDEMRESSFDMANCVLF